MPFTGIGLNHFPLALLDFYPIAPSLYGDFFVNYYPHAHNLYLQTALDFGLPGLAAFLGIGGLAIRGGLRALRRGREPALAAGLLLGLLAHAVYSLVDAVALGSKPGPLLWAVLGLLLALAPAAEPSAAPAHPGRTPPDRTALRRGLAGAAALGALLLLAPALMLNATLLFLHREEAPLAVRSPLFEVAASALERLAWGPYRARAVVVGALAARARGDLSAELAALEQARAAAPWDPSLPHQLAGARLTQSDPAQSLASGDRAVVDTLVRRARYMPPDVALPLLARARQVLPRELGLYIGAIGIQLRSHDDQAAADLLVEALRVTGLSTDRGALARRLLDRSAPLPALEPLVIPNQRDHAVLFSQARTIFERRGDAEGARYAAELTRRADRDRAPLD
jgi:hypothetical protein